MVVCKLLTACGNAKSVGVIGGADGPTSIIVDDRGEQQMYQQITAEEARLHLRALLSLVVKM